MQSIMDELELPEEEESAHNDCKALSLTAAFPC